MRSSFVLALVALVVASPPAFACGCEETPPGEMILSLILLANGLAALALPLVFIFDGIAKSGRFALVVCTWPLVTVLAPLFVDVRSSHHSDFDGWGFASAWSISLAIVVLWRRRRPRPLVIPCDAPSFAPHPYRQEPR